MLQRQLVAFFIRNCKSCGSSGSGWCCGRPKNKIKTTKMTFWKTTKISKQAFSHFLRINSKLKETKNLSRTIVLLYFSVICFYHRKKREKTHKKIIKFWKTANQKQKYIIMDHLIPKRWKFNSYYEKITSILFGQNNIP